MFRRLVSHTPYIYTPIRHLIFRRIHTPLFWACLSCFLPFSLFSQFHINSAATQSAERCWTLTPAQNTKNGSVWNEKKINLNESFEISADVFLGCQDANGADGIVFGLQPVSTSVGSTGGGLGFGGVSPSLGIELDTWQNTSFGDPSFDHISIIKNGNLDHASGNTLAGPKPFPNNANIEDCAYHDLYVVWNAKVKKLEIYWDCQVVLTHTGDIVKDIFNGDPNVFWGFTAATGGSNNEQKICLKYNTFLDQIQDTTICVGGQVQLQASGGVAYQWSPSTGLSSPTVPNPIAKPSVTTQYSVFVTDKCNRNFRDSLLVKVGGNPLTVDLGRDTVLCEGQIFNLKPNIEGAKYRWQDNKTDSVYRVVKTGSYKVNVERNFCYASDSVSIRFIKTPVVNLGVDTILCLGKKLVLKADVEEGVFRWYDGTKQNSVVVLKSGFYGVAINNRCGYASDNIVVLYEDCHQLFIPNAFSPNNDGQNDDFMLLDAGDVKNIRRFEIYDRWGSQVFQAVNFKPNDKAFAWSGEKYPVGIYTYFAEIEFKDGEVLIRKGDVTLMK
jgi:gliding motility-associated-like protein